MTQIDVVERAQRFLESSIKDYDRIFIDTCSLLFEAVDTFWSNIVPIVQRYRKSIIIPKRVCEEVGKFANDSILCRKKNPTNPYLHSRAVKAKKTIMTLQAAGLVEIFGNDTDNFADNVFLTVFTQYRMKYNLMLVTQDYNLAHDTINLDRSRSVNTNKSILVARIDKYGFLNVFNGGASYDSANRCC